MTGLEHSAHVLEKGGKVFSATLGLVDIVIREPTPITSCSSWRMTKRAGAPRAGVSSRAVLLRGSQCSWEASRLMKSMGVS